MSVKDPIRLNNGRLEIRLDPGSGKILAVRNLLSGLDLIDAALDTPPWRIEIERQEQWLERFLTFHYSVQDAPDGQHAALRWETEYGLTVTGAVHLPAGSDSVFFSIEVENHSDLPVDKIEYPILSGIGGLARDVPIALAHSQGTGFLFHDPLRTFQPEEGRKQGLRYSPYPEGFNGSTMQFMAYYAEKRGGFYFATRDSGKAMKWFNFYKDVKTAALFASIMHQAGRVEPGLSFAPGYEVEISALKEGTWYEAAERYKDWAVSQPWTYQGPLHSRPDRAGWLYEKVGISTFGVNAAHDRSRWLDAFHQMAGAPALHILGPNWANAGQDYMNHLPGGRMEDWLPGKFSPENLATIRANGDYWVPFEFDLLCSHAGDSPAPVMENRQVLPEKKYSFDRYWFPFMCPGTEYWRAFHARRDSEVIRQHAPDGIYYDISANNVLMACRSRSHDHHPGGGQEIADAFARMFDETKTAMAQTAGQYVPIGTEMISELLIPQVDFYQARAEASPSSAFEADFWRSWVVEGKVEKIPLFAYVYHEYGPVRMDGWAKLAAEVGEVFYWVASRVTLWGGIFELNYEFSPLEALDGQTDAPEQHYYPFDRRDEYTIDADKAAFVGEVARARAGWGNAFLAYGQMQPPPEFAVEPVKLSYHLYNCGKDLKQYGEKGEISVPSVVCSAWRAPDGRVAIFFANLLKQPQTIRPCIDPARYGLEQVEAYRLDADGEQRLAEVDTLDLPARRIIAVELR